MLLATMGNGSLLPLEVIRNHSKSGLLGPEFRLPFGELLGGDFVGLFRINLREPSVKRLGKLGRLLRRRVDGQDELAADAVLSQHAVKIMPFHSDPSDTGGSAPPPRTEKAARRPPA